MSQPGKYRPALALLTVLFFMWGLITALNDILIPYFKGVFELDNFRAMLVQSAFFGAYFVCSVPAGLLVHRIGYQWGIVVGLLVTGLGALLFYPASVLISYPMFLGALFVLATGITVLQVAANPFVTVLGPERTASARLNLTQAFNSVGTTIAPAVGSALLLAPTTGDPQARLQTVQVPYVLIAAVLVAIAVIFARARLPVLPREGLPGGRFTGHTRLWLGVGAIFAYVGAEVAIGSVMVLFLALPEIAQLSEQDAGYYTALYWGAAAVGRFAGAAIQSRTAPHRMLAFNAVLAILLIGAAVTVQGSIGMWSLLLVGLANSIMFPTIFSLSIAGLGEGTSIGSSLLVMGIVGGAIIPPVVGILADDFGFMTAIGATSLCYAYIWFFATVAGEAVDAKPKSG